jgi:hypothetical protein
MSDPTQDQFSTIVSLKRNVMALTQQAMHYQGVIESQGTEIRLLRQASNQSRVELDQLKNDVLILRMSLVGNGPTERG